MHKRDLSVLLNIAENSVNLIKLNSILIKYTVKPIKIKLKSTRILNLVILQSNK